ncbi:MAG: hypothetical protein Q9219_006752 [cf. Caloplaca sp. 3 TL-2023]
MSTIRQITPSPPRTPLQDTTNSMRSEPSSPPFHTAKTTQSTQSRRKFSIPFFRHLYLDSSESVPSPHSSLWDAPPVDAPLNTTMPVGNWNASGSDLPTPPEKPKSKKKGKRKERSQSTSPPVAIESSPTLRLDPSIHHPHLLDTITERSSRPTLRSYHPSIHSLRHNSPSIATLRARSLTLRKKSFSQADLPIPARRLLVSSSRSSLSIQGTDKQATPNVPRYDPPQRLPTPPGLPSFNTPEAINFRLPSPHTSFREKFRRHPTPEQIVYRRQTSHLPKGVVMRGENGELIRGRWKQSYQSGHMGYGTQGALENHPFNRAPMAEIASEGDGAGARSEDMQTGGAVGPAEEAPASTRKRGSRWERFVETTCFVCCGVEAAPDGQVLTAVPRRTGEDGRCQEAMMTGARPMDETGKDRRAGF